ncbi:MAG: class I SAM-dependent methyltransferase [Nitrospinota bacterium]|nr:class I SAM-dependent methyltransferase [Nitrospinota bacterium]
MDLKETGQSVHRHPWELSRAEVSLEILSRYLPASADFLDIGAGDLYFSRLLASRFSGKVLAVDTGYTGEEQAAERIALAAGFNDVEKGSVDCLILMDVLEHVEDTTPFLEGAFSKVREGGIVFITVPAFQFLFSEHDRFLNHFRRYTLHSLREEIKRVTASVETAESCYFYFSLFVFRSLGVMLHRMLKLNKQENRGAGDWRYSEKHPVTMIIRFILNIDFRLARIMGRLGVKIPGLSLCMVCRKKSV